MENEIWKDVPNYEGLYQVSNLGRVKSLPKTWVTGNNSIQTHSGIILKPMFWKKNGYCAVNLYKNGKMKSRTIHQLVAMTFLNHTPCGHELVIDHINDVKTDNRVENLQIVTHRYNTHKTQGRYSSQYKGVIWDKKYNKWVTRITTNGKLKYLGSFNCELKAHLAYQNKLKEISND